MPDMRHPCENMNLAPEADWRPVGPPVQKDDESLRADQYLALRYPFMSRARWRQVLETGEVRRQVGGQFLLQRPSYKVRTGDRFYLFRPEKTEPDVDEGIHCLWSSKGVMAVFKPGNLPMHECGPFRTKTFAAILAREFGGEWAAVHRLDRETSGIVLCAATPRLRQKLSSMFNDRKVQKEYLAIAHGAPIKDEWLLDMPIAEAEDSEIRIKKWVDPLGLPALTEFQCLGRAQVDRQQYSLLRAIPLTGRTNQIRVHAAYSGHHLVGDKLYHPDESVFLEYFETRDNRRAAQRTGFYRCCLHAARLRYQHPETREFVDIESALPPDMGDLWLRLLYPDISQDPLNVGTCREDKSTNSSVRTLS